MTVVIGILFLTLLFVTIQADAWLSPLWNFGGRKSSRIPRTRTTTVVKESEEQQDDVNMEKEASERSRLSRLPWWEDSWAEAFLNSFQSAGLMSSSISTETITDELSHYDEYSELPNAQTLHFCFLLHGHRGLSTDLSYLQRVMQHQAQQEKLKRGYNHNKDTTTTSSSSSNETAELAMKQDMIVHCATCNEYKTTDGVANGGERLVQEILSVIRKELAKRDSSMNHHDADGVQDITISIVGNSLGGIYGRYAIAKLAEQAERNETKELKAERLCGDRCVLLDDKYRLHFNVFCTTAAPHLGISKHTYVPLPRSAEIGVAHALGDTGRDLFRLNNLLKNMATCPTFLEPLRNFRKRVAYANAFATDFPVPASTAAFLSDESSYPHQFVQEVKTDPDTKQEHVVATLHTPQSWLPRAKSTQTSNSSSTEEDIADDLVHMSTSLDSLGWTKVFVDVRKEIPLRVALPRSLNIREKLNNSSLLTAAKARLSWKNETLVPEDGSATFISTTDAVDTGLEQAQFTPTVEVTPEIRIDDVTADDSAMNKLRQKGIIGSRELAAAMSTPEDNRLSFPIGHNLMVAMSRDGQLTKTINKGGRPVMDALAKELVQDIFDWNFDEENEEAQKATDAAERTLKQQQEETAAATATSL